MLEETGFPACRWLPVNWRDRRINSYWQAGLTGAGTEGCQKVLRGQRERVRGIFISWYPLCQQAKQFHHCLALGSILWPYKQNLNCFIFQSARKGLLDWHFLKSCAPNSGRGNGTYGPKARGTSLIIFHFPKRGHAVSQISEQDASKGLNINRSLSSFFSILISFKNAYSLLPLHLFIHLFS